MRRIFFAIVVGIMCLSARAAVDKNLVQSADCASMWLFSL